MCPGEVKYSERPQSSNGSDDGFGTMFSETERRMILYQTFDSVEEIKETNDALVQYVHDKISDNVKKHRESIKSIESTIEIQNKKIEHIESTLSEILNIVKVKQ